MNLKVREAISSDYIDISKLNTEVHNLHVKNRPDVFNINNALLKEHFNNLLNTDDTKLFVVEDTDKKESIAYSTVKIIDMQSVSILIPRRVAYIDDFCVNSNYKKNGIGRLLFQYIVDYVRAEGALSLQLVVWEFNKGAICFYEKMGMSTRNKKMELNL
ncbi:GNAT family N-acetyltransferase [Clostridium estertheticum]|uniref:GNAT family N-acetyltransferase n=1 Tax=Clostridium estertheticum TaxID=238834 RepID=UPI001CF21B3C|nr:GNAT family N-acetyltransferase [Clostridium estertheticum]MCB2358224.1 GNAT family N-acetyltransferase [Clostridium estertheticum]